MINFRGDMRFQNDAEMVARLRNGMGFRYEARVMSTCHLHG